MPFTKGTFKVICKGKGRVWNLGPYPDPTVALAIFNGNAARREGLGSFKFADPESDAEYYLVHEQGGSEVLLPLAET
jgi:hypothetical protein